MKRRYRMIRRSRRSPEEQKRVAVIQSMRYRETHLATCQAAQRIRQMKQRLAVLKIIGSVCIDCKNPNKIPQAAHLYEDPTHFWSGPAHRKRVGRGHVLRHLLQLHKQGTNIKKIVIALCNTCNQVRASQWRKENVKS